MIVEHHQMTSEILRLLTFEEALKVHILHMNKDMISTLILTPIIIIRFTILL